jgi:hypothetical protein
MIVGAILALAALALLVVWLVPRFQARRWAAQGIEGRELAELENGARATVVQVVGGVALILTFVATWLQISDTRKATDRTLRLTATQQETERFTRAVDQLGSDRVEVRVGGIYGLQQTAEDSPPRRSAVAHLMLAFLRSHHPLPRGKGARLRAVEERVTYVKEYPDIAAGPCELATVRAWPDTQAALTVLLQLRADLREPLDLSSVDLIGVRAPGGDFTGADLQFTALAGAYLPDATFDKAKVYDSDLRLACVRGARFDDAYVFLIGGKAASADLSGADFSRACGALSDSLAPAITDGATKAESSEPSSRIDCEEP